MNELFEAVLEFSLRFTNERIDEEDKDGWYRGELKKIFEAHGVIASEEPEDETRKAVHHARNHCNHALERLSRPSYPTTVSAVLHLGQAVQFIGHALTDLNPDIRDKNR